MIDYSAINIPRQTPLVPLLEAFSPFGRRSIYQENNVILMEELYAFLGVGWDHTREGEKLQRGDHLAPHGHVDRRHGVTLGGFCCSVERSDVFQGEFPQLLRRRHYLVGAKGGV